MHADMISIYNDTTTQYRFDYISKSIQCICEIGMCICELQTN